MRRFSLAVARFELDRAPGMILVDHEFALFFFDLVFVHAPLIYPGQPGNIYSDALKLIAAFALEDVRSVRYGLGNTE